jgi:hypothetical protein
MLMEISGIDKVQTIKKVEIQEGVQPAHIEDTVIISSESKKKAEWVEMLKQMPDIRDDKIAAALANPFPSLSAVAQRIAQSGF